MPQQRTLIPLLLLIFLDSFGFFLVIPVLIHLIFSASGGLLSTDASLAQRNIIMGIIMALGFLATIVAAPIVGSCSDKYGRKPTFLLCLLISLFGFLLPIAGIIYHSIFLVGAGRFLAGVGSASQPIAQAAVADITQGVLKKKYLSLIAAAMTLALLLGPLCGGYLSDAQLNLHFNNTTPYILGTVVVLLNIILLWSLFHETHIARVGAAFNWRQLASQFLPALQRYRIGKLLLAMFLLELGWSQYYNAMPLILGQYYHYSANSISNFMSYVGLLMFIGLIAFYPWLVRRIVANKILVASIVLVTIGLIACALVSNITVQWLAVIPVTVFTGISYVALLAALSDRVGVEHQGWLMGCITAVVAIAWMLTSFMTGWLLDAHVLLPLQLAAVFLLIASGLVWSVVVSKR